MKLFRNAPHESISWSSMAKLQNLKETYGLGLKPGGHTVGGAGGVLDGNSLLVILTGVLVASNRAFRLKRLMFITIMGKFWFFWVP